MLDIKNLRFTFDLPPRLGDVLYLLLTQQFVSSEEMDALFANPRVGMYRLRKIVTPFGIDIQMRTRLGYFITDDTKRDIIAMVERAIVSTPLEDLEVKEDASA